MNAVGTLFDAERLIQNHSSQYYLERYAGYGLQYHTQVIKWLCRDFTDSQQGLDVGCGTGIIGSLHQGLQLTGIDLSPKMIELAKTLPYRGRGIYHVMDVLKMPEEWTEQFDYVICRSLLHHLPNHVAALQQMARVLKPRGQFVCWETNQSWLASWVRSKTQHGDRFSEYHHSFRDHELVQAIRRFFETTEVAYQGFVCYPLFGFPDILPLYKFIPFKSVMFPLTWKLDQLLGATPCLKRLSFSIGIRAIKQ